MVASHNQRTELDYKHLKPRIIQLSHFAPSQQFCIDVPHHAPNLSLAGQEEQFIILQQSHQLHNCQNLLSLLVVLEFLTGMPIVTSEGIDKEEMAEDFVVFFESSIYGL